MKQARPAIFVTLIIIAISFLLCSCSTNKSIYKPYKHKKKLTVAYQPCFK